MRITTGKLIIAAIAAGLVAFGVAFAVEASVLAVYATGIVAVAIVMFAAAFRVARANRSHVGRSGAASQLAPHS